MTEPPLKEILEAFNSHDVDRVMSLFADDCVMDMPRGPAPGGRPVSEWTIRGTQANGERIEVRGCDILEFTDGKISRKNSYWKIID